MLMLDPIPPTINPATPNTSNPYSAELLQRRARNSRRMRTHRLGLWICPRCDRGRTIFDCA